MEGQDSRCEVKKIVVGYDLKSLPPALIRSVTLLRSKITRKRFRIEVVMRPLNQLPADTDVLLIPEGLVEQARNAAPHAAWIGLLDIYKTYQPAFDALLQELEAGETIYARRVEGTGGLERTGDRGGVVVRYRGSERIG